MTIIIAVALIVVLIIVGVPVAYAFAAGTMLTLIEYGEITQLTSVAYRTIDSFPLMAIPFFLLSGVLMKNGGVSRRLVDFVGLATGRIKGGMGATMVGASALFGAISGSSVATVSAIGSMMTPEMERRGYPRGYIGGLASVSGILGILIPPSVPMVVYGISANVSVGDMFIAGIGPGLVLLAFMLVVNHLWARHRQDLDDRGTGPLAALGDDGDTPAEGGHSTDAAGGTTGTATLAPPRTTTTPTPRKRLTLMGLGRTGAAIPALLMPVIILGGIYGGIFTPTEAGAVACFYALLVGIWVYRELRLRDVPRTMLDGMLATAPILLIIAIGGAFSRSLTLSGLPADIATWIADLGLSTLGFMVLLNVFLLIVGCLVEENTAIIILTPLLLPITTSFGLDPIHVGVIMVLNLGLGLATPPMAPNAFIAAKACGVPFHKLIGTTVKFLVFAGLPTLIVINAFPVLSLWFM
jgi:C4-dicarboxylate transporter, DctM subunit